jgi:dethiobiotin synthetase
VRHATELLSAWEVEHRPDLVFIEGAGGLHVPMPGGDWQPTWISALAHHVVVVGSLGLGTINHTLLTIDALRNLGLPPLGFYLCEHDPTPDPSHRDNAQIIATARGLSHLGTLRQTSPSDGPGTLDLLTPLLTLLPTSSF